MGHPALQNRHDGAWLDGPVFDILLKNDRGGLLHMVNGVYIMLGSTAFSKRHSAIFDVFACPRIIPVKADFLALSLFPNMQKLRAGLSTQRSQNTWRVQALFMKVGLLTTLAGHPQFPMFITGMPRDATNA